jgi:hypothetical protein
MEPKWQTSTRKRREPGYQYKENLAKAGEKSNTKQKYLIVLLYF